MTTLSGLDGDDFVGVQTYSRLVIGSQGVIPPARVSKKNQMGEEYYNDVRWPEFFQRALRCVANSLESGIDVRGYFCWSAMDNMV